MGIQHKKITPEHPQANGNAERFMTSLAKVVRVVKEEKRDWRVALNAFVKKPETSRPLSIGDQVCARTKRTNKWQSAYSNEELVVTATNGSMVTVKSSEGRVFSRNRRFFVKRPSNVLDQG
jgi:hypothetical protein